jgi:glycosyltransferase involved in cell wall biosynthesis
MTKNVSVLHFNSTSAGGAYNAAYHTYLAQKLNTELNAKFLTRQDYYKYLESNTIFRLKAKLRRILSRQTELQQKLQVEAKNCEAELTSYPFSKNYLEDLSVLNQYDVIHLHWLGEFIDLARFLRKIHKPIVFTLHDENIYSGIFHYTSDKLRNDHVNQLNNELIQFVKNLLKTYPLPIAFTSPSGFILENTKKTFGIQSNLFYQLIPYSLPMDRYCPNFNEQAKFVGFIAGNLNNYRKGFDLLTDAIADIDAPFLAIGSRDARNEDSKIKFLGHIQDVEELVNYYNQMKFLVLPSREDNLPNTMLEALACGVPVVAFKVGGMAEHIKDGFTGILADEVSSESLRNAILKANDIEFDRRKIRDYAAQTFSSEKQANAYINLYKEILSFPSDKPKNH